MKVKNSNFILSLCVIFAVNVLSLPNSLLKQYNQIDSHVCGLSMAVKHLHVLVSCVNGFKISCFFFFFS